MKRLWVLALNLIKFAFKKYQMRFKRCKDNT